MKILIKQAQIVDPNSPFNGQTADILIVDGTISRIAASITDATDQEINFPGLFVSPGWVDVFARFADPGYEFKETLESGAAAAAAGGFTDVLVIPNTNPVIHNKAGVEYIRQKANALPVSIYPIGAVTKNTEGKELAEMYDMQNSGAVAFGDGTHCIQSAGLLVKALQYVKAFDGVIIQIPDDKTINAHGLMHEGIASTQLGLPGKPSLAEELIIARDIKLTRYAESKLHFTGVAAAKSLEYIRRAKEGGIQITCSITPYHLYFTDEDLRQYDSNLKVNPPLRTAADRKALREAVLDETIDCFATHHLPHETDSKVLEFEYAQYGMIGLETAYAVINTALEQPDPQLLVRLMSVKPRSVFRLPAVAIREGEAACLTLFCPGETWTVSEKDFRSRSRNSAFTGKTLTGRVKGIIHKSQVQLNN